MKPAAFLFDLDGTLVDTEALWTKAIVDFVVSRGGRTTYEEILPTVIGRNWLDIDRSLHERFPEIGESSAMEDAVELRRFYDVYATNPSSMRIDGSIAFFHAVSKIAPCAIVSGSPHDDVVAAAKLCGIDDRLSLVLGAGEYAAGKPSPSGFLKAAELLKDHDDIRFVIFGAGSEYPATEEYIRRNDLNNTALHPLLPADRISEVYSLGDVALITGKKGVGATAMPSKTWSIMACNTPIIASFDTDSELAEVIESSGAGKCVEPEDPQALAAAIEEAFIEKPQSSGREYVKRHADKTECVSRYVRCIEEAAAR